jgi:hydrogenase expression/formation protein HypD
MKYIDEFRNKDLIRNILRLIQSEATIPLTFMEVCGGHTMSIHKFGIPSLLPENISLLSGPGCPVCVSSRSYIDQALAYARLKDVILCTFGDLIRVPGSSSSLEKAKSEGADIRMVYSPLDAVDLAEKNPDRKIVFLGIGFETTSPGSAAAVLQAHKKGISNFYLYSSHKIMPPAMQALIKEGIPINGYIAPGHVSTITGSAMYESLVRKYKVACVISGFEPLDILQSIYMLLMQTKYNNPKVEIQYKRVVQAEGNLKAQALLKECFTLRDDWWRGLGILPDSGFQLKKTYEKYDAEKQIPVEVEKTKEEKGCICGDILKGLHVPEECKLFRSVCTPMNPVGACMVSNEGACAAHYKYALK